MEMVCDSCFVIAVVLIIVVLMRDAQSKNVVLEQVLPLRKRKNTRGRRRRR